MVAEAIIKRLNSRGFIAYFAGGCVRDMIMKRKPDDYDIATSARPDETRRLFAKTLAIGQQFGVILILEGPFEFEVATFRREGPYLDGRHPTNVRFTDAREDALRRDFTVNALFYDLRQREVIDYVDGQKDIEQKLIRSVGSPYKRFEEDKLRMLRAVRFSCKLDFQIEPETYQAIQDTCAAIHQVSIERIRDELIKICTSHGAGRALELLLETGLLKELLPEVCALKGVEQPREFHPEGDVFEHTRRMMDLLENPNPVLAFATLLHDIAKPATFQQSDRIRFNEHDKRGAEMAEHILRRLRFSNRDIETVSIMIANHMRFMHVKQMKPTRLEHFMLRPTFPDELVMHRIDCLASHGDLSVFEFLTEKYKELQARPPAAPPVLSGRDLLGAGYTQGPYMGEVLRQAEEAYLEGIVQTKEEALRWVKEHFPPLTNDT
ncbi:MAG: HD domain-containing protein [Candidatus Omnitrophica bacterium]|nr:HD domain-containing protein [Candidatus Omnitrophota bacterium]